MTRQLSIGILVLVIVAAVSAGASTGAEPYPYCQAPDASYVPPNPECAKTLQQATLPPGYSEFNPLNSNTCSGLKPVYSDGCALAYAELYCLTYCTGTNTFNPVPTRDICDRIAKYCDPCIQNLQALNPNACGPDAPLTYNMTFPIPPAKGIYYRFEGVLTPQSRYLPQNQGSSSASIPVYSHLSLYGILGYIGFLIVTMFSTS